MIRTILVTVIFLFFATMAGAEYYQYTDETGNLRFTDDMSQIPESQRKEVEKFASEISPVMETQSDLYSEAPETDAEITPSASPETYVEPGAGTFEVKASELNKMQAELNITNQALEQVRADLEANAPAEDAKSNDRIAYSMKVEALNARIEQYGKDLKAFEQKVESFNNRGKIEPE